MSAAEDKLQVLKMVQSGEITAEEGARRLEALEKTRGSPAEPGAGIQAEEPRLLRIRVTDLRTGKQKADLRLPWNLVSVGVSLGARVAMAHQEIRLDDFVEAVESGAKGKILEVVAEEDNERVEVFAE